MLVIWKNLIHVGIYLPFLQFLLLRLLSTSVLLCLLLHLEVWLWPVYILYRFLFLLFEFLEPIQLHLQCLCWDFWWFHWVCKLDLLQVKLILWCLCPILRFLAWSPLHLRVWMKFLWCNLQFHPLYMLYWEGFLCSWLTLLHLQLLW